MTDVADVCSWGRIRAGTGRALDRGRSAVVDARPLEQVDQVREARGGGGGYVGVGLCRGQEAQVSLLIKKLNKTLLQVPT